MILLKSKLLGYIKKKEKAEAAKGENAASADCQPMFEDAKAINFKLSISVSCSLRRDLRFS